MKTRDYSRLLTELADELARRSPGSASMDRRARAVLVDGASHPLRSIRPFPPRIVTAHGAWVRDQDGHDVLDFWQGHLANILGHNPSLVTSALAHALGGGAGLETGMLDRLEVEAAEILCRQTGADLVRFSASGSLSNMSAVMLARAFTGRELVVKVGGGWHGTHPWALKGVAFDTPFGSGFQHVDSEGLPAAVTEAVLVTGFNDPERLRDCFRTHGDAAACFVVEPVLGAGGFIPATREYLRVARELTHHHGALLILDEVITGFRFRAGDLGSVYGLRPDLAVFGKVIGGGMPVSALGGRADVMSLLGRDSGSRVNVSGGTYSAHPGSLLAARTIMEHLVENQDQVYPRLAALGESIRATIETAFGEEGVLARCTGHDPEVLPGSSLAMVHFPYRGDTPLSRPEQVNDPAECDVALRRDVLDGALLCEGVHLLHGHGAATTAHTAADVELLGQACRKVARRLRPHL